MSFYVTHDNRRWLVTTEVGDGPTRVHFEEDQREPVAVESLDNPEEQANG